MKYPEYIQNRLESLGRREECLQIKLEEWCLKANLIKTTSKAINKELCCQPITKPLILGSECGKKTNTVKRKIKLL